MIEHASHHVQHMQKALEQMNVKLREVINDITGKTGMAIIRAILHGERDPRELAKLRQVNCKRTEAEIARALYGNWRAEHLFALRQAVALYEFYQLQLDECDAQLAQHLVSMTDHSAGKAMPAPRRRPARTCPNEPRFAARASLFRMSGVDLTCIEGVSVSPPWWC